MMGYGIHEGSNLKGRVPFHFEGCEKLNPSMLTCKNKINHSFMGVYNKILLFIRNSI